MILKHKEGEILVGEMTFTGQIVGGNKYEYVVTRSGTPITATFGWETKANNTIKWTANNNKCYVQCAPNDNQSDNYAVTGSLICNSFAIYGSGLSHASAYNPDYGRGLCLYWLRNLPSKYQSKYPNGALIFSNNFYGDTENISKFFDVNSGNTPGTTCYTSDSIISSRQTLIDVNRVINAYGADIDPDPQPEPPKFPGDDNTDDNPGGDGEGPDGLEDDPIEAPEDPGISAVDSGLLTLYVPSLNNIHEFGNFLWSDLFSLDTFKKLFADPMEAVIGISVLPISVPHTAGAESITIGQIESGVFAPLASKQFVKKDCGTLSVKPLWNTALDYDPYTKFSIYLPYIGTRDLKTDDIMGKDLNVSYLIDILSGSCTAHIKVGGSVLYQFSGSCAVPIPLSGTSWTNLLTSSIQLAGTGIAAAMTAGASTVVSAAATGMAVAGTAGLVSASKQAIQRTGAVSGAAGMLGVQYPYLIRETPRQSLAKGYNKFVGYPSNITSKLGDLKGYTQVENIHLDNLTCTADEAAEIESLLKSGVII